MGWMYHSPVSSSKPDAKLTSAHTPPLRRAPLPGTILVDWTGPIILAAKAQWAGRMTSAGDSHPQNTTTQHRFLGTRRISEEPPPFPSLNFGWSGVGLQDTVFTLPAVSSCTKRMFSMPHGFTLGAWGLHSEKSLCAGLLLVQLMLTLEFHLQSPEQGLHQESQHAETTSCTSYFIQHNQRETRFYCAATG